MDKNTRRRVKKRSGGLTKDFDTELAEIANEISARIKPWLKRQRRELFNLHAPLAQDIFYQSDPLRNLKHALDCYRRAVECLLQLVSECPASTKQTSDTKRKLTSPDPYWVERRMRWAATHERADEQEDRLQSARQQNALDLLSRVFIPVELPADRSKATLTFKGKRKAPLTDEDKKLLQALEELVGSPQAHTFIKLWAIAKEHVRRFDPSRSLGGRKRLIIEATAAMYVILKDSPAYEGTRWAARQIEGIARILSSEDLFAEGITCVRSDRFPWDYETVRSRLLRLNRFVPK